MQVWAQRIIGAPIFEGCIITLILLNGVILGMETSPHLVAQFGSWFTLGSQVILGMFHCRSPVETHGGGPSSHSLFS